MPLSHHFSPSTHPCTHLRVKSTYCVPGLGLGGEYSHGVCSLEAYGLVGEMGFNQSTPQVYAHEGRVITVLTEEEEMRKVQESPVQSFR